MNFPESWPGLLPSFPPQDVPCVMHGDTWNSAGHVNWRQGGIAGSAGVKGENGRIQ